MFNDDDDDDGNYLCKSESSLFVFGIKGKIEFFAESRKIYNS